MLIDLLLIHPGAQHGVYGSLGDTLTALEPPTWTRMIAGYVRDRGFSVQILDAEAEQQGAHEVGQIARDARPRLICIVVAGHQPSASTQQMVGASAIAKAIKAQCESPVIMVGGHPSALPDRTLREESVDYVAVGEGPLTILGLLRGDDRGAIPGLVYENGYIIKNKSAPLIENLDELHGDVWDILPMNRYRSHSWQVLDNLSRRQPYASIYTTLGCPHFCSFCMINAPFESNRYRMRRPESVVAQITGLYRDYGVKTIKFADEMFILAPRHYTAIAEGLIASGIADDINIWAYSRIDSIRPDTLSLLHRAGIRWLALGIESGSAHVRNGANKKMRTEDIVGTVKTIQRAGIYVIGNFMVGLADDTAETMKQTYDLAIECMPDWSNWYVTMAYPGSALYTQALKEGRTLPPNWKSFSQHNEDCFPLANEHLTSAQILKFRDEAFTAFFTDPRYLSHVERKFGAAAVAHIRDMTRYKLKRKLLEAA
jgi:radical SAM superfamily enzyme YgiQ (UPF0313 family)